MPYVVVENFDAGWDERKSAVTAPPGTLRVLRDCYVNAGGEIEKRKAFVIDPSINLAGTFGLKGFGGVPYVFGTTARPASLSQNVGYHQIAASSVLRVRDVDVFDDKFYVVIEATPGVFEHYYDGKRVADAPNSPTAMAHRSKMYSVVNNVVHFSGLNDPSKWAGATGAGFIQLDTQETDAWTLVGLAAYYDQLALFGRSAVQLWAMDEDPNQNQMIQTVSNVGLVASLALSRFSSGDVLFLADSGIRSLRARDSSNAASVTDVGSPIDDPVTTWLAGLRESQRDTLWAARALIEPRTGQFWLFAEDRIFVLSLAPSTRISAWALFNPGMPIQYADVIRERLAFRSGDGLGWYGGYWGKTYDNTEAEVVMPMLSAGTPATDKLFFGLDAAIEGTWAFEVGTDPSRPDVREPVATISGPSFSMQQIGLQNTGTHIGVRATTRDASRARMGQMLFHYNEGHKG